MMLSLSLIISLFVLFIPLGFSLALANYVCFLKNPEVDVNAILKLFTIFSDFLQIIRGDKNECVL